MLRTPQRFSKAARIVWAAPCTALGLLIAAAASLTHGKARWVDGALECSFDEYGAVGRVLRHQPFAAITLGHVVIGATQADLQRLSAHERVHVKQFERWGALMLLAYPAASLWAWLQGQDPYLANCFEREAYLAEELAHA